MTREQIIEAMARAMSKEDSGPFGDVHWDEFGESYVVGSRAALSAIEALGYVIVPVTPTEPAVDAGISFMEQIGYLASEMDAMIIYRAMIEAGKV